MSSSSSANATPTHNALSRADCARFMPLVRRIAKGLARRLPRHVELDELLSQGSLGLVEAISRAPASMATMASDEVEAFVSRRVKGAMLDYLRSNSPSGRERRNADRRAARASERDPSTPAAAPVAPKFEMVDVDTVMIASDAAAPDELVAWAMERDRIVAAIDALPTRERQMLSLHYVDECTLKEIGRVFGVTESRVSQILARCVARLR